MGGAGADFDEGMKIGRGYGVGASKYSMARVERLDDDDDDDEAK